MALIVFYYFLFFYFYWRNKDISDDNLQALKRMSITSFLLLFIFFGFRNITVLCDTPHYYSSLRDKMSYAANLPWYYFNPLERFEPGYQIFETIHAKLFSNPYSIIISSSLIIIVGNIWFFKKMNGMGLFMCLFLLMNYQLPNQFSAIRQGIATIILYYAIYNLLNGNLKKYLIASAFACTFHVTAVVAFLLYPLKYLRFNKKTIIIFIIAFLVIINFLLKPLIGFFSTDTVYGDTNADRTSFPLGSFILLSLFVWLFYSARRYYVKYRNVTIDNYLWMFSGVCLLLQAIDVVFPIVGRIAMYFAPILISLYVTCLRSIPDLQYRRNQTFITFFVFFSWFILYNLLKPEWYYLYPYSFMDIDQIFNGYEIDR